MGEFIKRICIFFLLLLIVWFVSIGLYASLVPARFQKNVFFNRGGVGYKRFQNADSVKNIDILFVGSSHAYRSFDPRIFARYDYKIFNFGSSSQSPVQTLYILKTYIKRFKPRLVVYEVNSMTFSGEGVESACDIESNTTHLNYELCKMVLTTNHVAAYNTFAYVLFQSVLPRVLFSGLSKILGTEKYVTGGYVEKANSSGNEEDIPAMNKRVVELDKKQKKAFKDALNFLKFNGIKVVLAQVPVTSSVYNSVANQGEYDSYFSSHGLKYFNFNKLSPMSYQYFYDRHHLNQMGVEIFDSIFINKCLVSLK